MVLAAAILSFQSVAAADGLIYQSGEPIDFRGGCVVNGTYCSTTTSCNITAFFPGGAVYVNNLPTTNQRTFYNRTLPEVSVLGEYSAKLVCYDPVAGYAGTEDFTFKLTSTGTTGNGNLTIFILLISCSIIIFIVSLIIHNEYVGAISAFLLIAAGLYFTIYGIGIEANLYTNAIGFSMIGLGAVLLMICAYRVVTDGDGFNIGNKATPSDDNDIFNFKQEED